MKELTIRKVYISVKGMIQQINEILVELKFSPLDYAADRAAFAAKVIAKFSKRNGFCPEQCAEEVSRELDRIYEDAKSVSVESTVMPDHLRTGDYVGIIIGGILIWGLVAISPKTLSVEISSPYEGKRLSSEIELLAPRIWTEMPCEGSEANDEGKKKAVSLLTELYYSYIENHS